MVTATPFRWVVASADTTGFYKFVFNAELQTKAMKHGKAAGCENTQKEKKTFPRRDLNTNYTERSCIGDER